MHEGKELEQLSNCYGLVFTQNHTQGRCDVFFKLLATLGVGLLDRSSTSGRSGYTVIRVVTLVDNMSYAN